MYSVKFQESGEGHRERGRGRERGKEKQTRGDQGPMRQQKGLRRGASGIQENQENVMMHVSEGKKIFPREGSGRVW